MAECRDIFHPVVLAILKELDNDMSVFKRFEACHNVICSVKEEQLCDTEPDFESLLFEELEATAVWTQICKDHFDGDLA